MPGSGSKLWLPVTLVIMPVPNIQVTGHVGNSKYTYRYILYIDVIYILYYIYIYYKYYIIYIYIRYILYIYYIYNKCNFKMKLQDDSPPSNYIFNYWINMSLSLNHKHHNYTNYLSSVNFHIILDNCDFFDKYGIVTIIVDNY